MSEPVMVPPFDIPGGRVIDRHSGKGVKQRFNYVSDSGDKLIISHHQAYERFRGRIKTPIYKGTKPSSRPGEYMIPWLKYGLIQGPP